MTTRQTPQPKSHLGQLLIIGFDGASLTPRLASLLKRIQPAGVILLARNIKDPAQTWRLLRDCQKCVSTPLFKCVDLEGGAVDRFRDVLGPTPSAAEVFASGDRKLFRRHGQLIGENCRALGFNVTFAPVLDLALQASRKVLGSRAVSANPRETIVYAREFLTGLRAAGVLGCGKHFPGLGEGKLDSHRQRPMIDKGLKRLWAEDLLPYRTLRGQLPFVMISHAAYPQVTNDRAPASLSEAWITGILRKRIGYRNLIVSDDLEMGGVLSAASVDQAAVEHIRSGGDLCLICHSQDFITRAYDAMVNRVIEDRGLASRAAESVRRVLAYKRKWADKLRGRKPPPSAIVEERSRKLWEFGEQVRLAALDRQETHRGKSSRQPRQ